MANSLFQSLVLINILKLLNTYIKLEANKKARKTKLENSLHLIWCLQQFQVQNPLHVAHTGKN